LDPETDLLDDPAAPEAPASAPAADPATAPAPAVAPPPSSKLAPGHDVIEDGIDAVDMFGEKFAEHFPEYKELSKVEFRVPRKAIEEAMKDPVVRNLVFGMRHAGDRKNRILAEEREAFRARAEQVLKREESIRAQSARLKLLVENAAQKAPKPNVDPKGVDPYSPEGQRTLAQLAAHEYLNNFAKGLTEGVEELENEGKKILEEQQRSRRLDEIKAFAERNPDFDSFREDIKAYRKDHPGTPVEAAYHTVRAIRHATGSKRTARGDTAKETPPADTNESPIPKAIRGDPVKIAEFLQANPEVRKAYLERALARG